MPILCHYFATMRFPDKLPEAVFLALRGSSAASSVAAQHGRQSCDRRCRACVDSLGMRVLYA